LLTAVGRLGYFLLKEREREREREQAMDLAAGYILGHYRLIEKLGEGGMGVVWKARDLKLERDIAIKVLPEGAVDDPDRRAFFEREAKAVAALHHPNIVTIYAIKG
jgi:serine/threonine protein kinase